MANLLIATEDPHFIFRRLCYSSFQILDYMRDRILQNFIDIFLCKRSGTYLIDSRTLRDNELPPFAFQDLITAIGSKYQQKTQDWSRPKKNSEGGGDPQVFNVLDAILKCSLERLKLMRENISWAHIGHYNYTLKASYTQHLDTIRNLSLEGRLGVALWLRNKMIHQGITPDVITHNYIINGFCKIGAFEKAEWLVSEMCYRGPPPNCATYNTLMKGYCAFSDIDKALDLLSTMSDEGNKVKPNIVTFNILVHALCKQGLSEEARVLLGKLTDENSQKNLIALTILMDTYFKNGDTSLALTLWGEICEKEVDVVSYNVIVHGTCMSSDLIDAYKYVNKMFKIGLLPDNFTYNTLINALCKMKRIYEAYYLYTVMSKMGVSPDRVSYNILIQGLCSVGDCVSAHKLLNRMLEMSMVPPPLVWNVIIHGYGKQGDKQNALHIRDQMMKHGVSPNVFTCNALIHMLIKIGEIPEAHLLMKNMLLGGDPLPDTITYNLLVGAESESGHLYSAYQVYDDMLKRGYDPDVVTYTELIKGFCTRGKVEEAERILSVDMLQNSNIVIDHVPFQILMKKYFVMRDFESLYGVYQKWLRMDQGE